MEQFANNAVSTLNGNISAGATSLTVVSATAFPGSGNFRILVDQEVMLVTAVAGPSFTVTRAQEGTSAAAHSIGAPVTCILTAGALVQLKADAVASAGGWTTVIDVDFTAQTSLNPVTDGTHVWGGVTFTKINTAKDFHPCQLVNGTGLQFSPTGVGATCGIFQNHTLSAITIPLTSALATIDPSTPIRIWLYQSNETQLPQGNGGLGEGPWIAIDDWNGSQYSWSWSAFRGAGGSGNGFYTLQESPTISGSQAMLSNFVQAGVSPQVFVLYLPEGTGGREAFIYRSDTFPGGNWPAAANLIPIVFHDTTSIVFNSATFTGYQPLSATRILIGVSGDPGFNGFDGYVATLARFRVDVNP